MTDFGADESFVKACVKMREHYGIKIPVSSQRQVTLTHAESISKIIQAEVAAKNKRKSRGELSSRKGSKFIISETDGSMVPIVVSKKSATGKKTKKEVMYREARVTMAYEKGSVTRIFSATFDNVDIVGKHIRYCVDKAGCGKNSKIHAVGDGAVWISEQIDKQFGSQAKYLIDFYHASEYLAAAAHECATIAPIKWLHAQQQLLKCGKYQTVLNNMNNYAHQHEDSATSKCYQYLKKRSNQLHYDKAIKNELPIGSGEIESAHRYIIQNRVKITGAWWLLESAKSMIHLSVHRTNKQWDNYWQDTMAA